MIKNFMEKIKNKFNNNSKIAKYGEFNSYDLLKNIAIFAMVIDHLGYFFFWRVQILRLIGRITILILAVLYGFSHKKDKKPRKEILIFAVITTVFQLLFMGFGEAIPLNVLYNFYISAFLIDYLMELYEKYYWGFLLLLLFMIPISFTTNRITEYGIALLLLMFCGQIFKKEEKDLKDKETTAIIFIMFSFYQWLNFRFNIMFFVILQIIYLNLFILLYDFKSYSQKLKEHIKKVPTIFYIFSRNSLEFYTVHLVVLMVIYKVVRWLF